MTTSGSITYNPARDVIVNRALRLIGAYSSNDSATAAQKADAYDVLNAMLKSWQVEGFSWVRAFATLTLVQAQNSYDLGTATADNFVYSGTVNKAARPLGVVLSFIILAVIAVLHGTNTADISGAAGVRYSCELVISSWFGDRIATK